MQGTFVGRDRFWRSLDTLVATHRMVIDRPRDSPHPCHPVSSYPLDYGYLDGTRSPDGDGIDVWIGSLPGREVMGVVITVDLVKHDSEIKLLLACTVEEMDRILPLHNVGAQSAVLITRHERV